MSRFNFTDVILDDDADVEVLMNNFNKIEQNAAMLTDLASYQTKSAQSNTLNSSSTNNTYPGSKAVYDALPAKNMATLSLVDGAEPTQLSNNTFYNIAQLKVNNVVDSDFTFSLIFHWSSGSTHYIVRVYQYNNFIGNPTCIAKRYTYSNGSWSITTNKTIQYSTVDLQDGVSQLPTGSIYFVYE